MSAENKHGALDAYIAQLCTGGLTYNAAFIPKAVSRNSGEKSPSLNWRIALAKGDKRVDTDYMQGIGHVPGYIYDSSIYENRVVRAEQERAAETGVYPILETYGRNGKRFKRVGFRTKHCAAPELRDVLHCLVLDASVLNANGFEDWASDCGYDTDSREAERMYDACKKLAYDLQRLLGQPTINKLAELFQDY